MKERTNEDTNERTNERENERTYVRASCPVLLAIAHERADGLASFDALSRSLPLSLSLSLSLSLHLSSLHSKWYARTSQFTPLATRWHVHTVHGGGRKNAPGGLRQHTPKIYVSPDPTRALKVAKGARGDHRRRASAEREYKYNRNSNEHS